MKKILTIICVLSLFVLLVACGTEEAIQEEAFEMKIVGDNTGGVVSSGTAQVVIENSKFMPTDLVVSIGTTVEWVNKDSTDHTVSLENGDLDELLPQGATGTFTFNEKGEFRYFCKLHPGMQGNVIVN
jgi:plastocyanin